MNIFHKIVVLIKALALILKSETSTNCCSQKKNAVFGKKLSLKPSKIF